MAIDSNEVELLVPLACWRVMDVPGVRALLTAPPGRYMATPFGNEVQLRPVGGGAVYKLTTGEFATAQARGDVRG